MCISIPAWDGPATQALAADLLAAADVVGRRLLLLRRTGDHRLGAGPAAARATGAVLRHRHAGDAGGAAARAAPIICWVRNWPASTACSRSPGARRSPSYGSAGRPGMWPRLSVASTRSASSRARDKRFACALGYMGTYAADRHATVQALLLAPPPPGPILALPDRRAAVSRCGRVAAQCGPHRPPIPARSCGVLQQQRRHAQRHARRDGPQRLLPVGAPVRGGGMRRLGSVPTTGPAWRPC